MKVMSLDGEETVWKLKSKKKGKKSNLHLKARSLLQEIYLSTLLEEVTIQTTHNTRLYLDFYIPLHKLCIEVHGEQHYKYSPFFHKNVMDFVKQRKNDVAKAEWCELNGIELIELPYNENIDEWRSKFI